METKYLSCAETAKLVRTALKKNFPGVKFSVRSSVYSGGASIDVSWVLGPTTKEVDAVAGQYASADFDGSIDMETRYDHWLLPDGSAIIKHGPVLRDRWVTFRRRKIRCPPAPYRCHLGLITYNASGDMLPIGRTKPLWSTRSP